MKKVFSAFLLVAMIFSTLDLHAIQPEPILDLNVFSQEFIVETKQIHVPGFPDAFNPSIVLWKDRLLMCFRCRDPHTGKANLVGISWLDKNFELEGEPQLLEFTHSDLTNRYIQDPRLCVINGALKIYYSDLWEDAESQSCKRKMCAADIEYDGIKFIATHEDYFLDYQGIKNNKFEKNWIPFDYQGVALLAYTISPHKIFLPICGESRCITVANNLDFSSWDWGILRGGTPALLVDNYYLSFFHSSLVLSSHQSDGRPMPHYFMGAYLFENVPPFAIKKISPEPIVSKEFYTGVEHSTWKPLRVIFPCGFIHDKDYIWISYGRQDYEAWIVKLHKTKLLKSLVSYSHHHNHFK